MSCDFKPGDEVVCVDAAPHAGFRRTAPGLVHGATYTIREVLDAGALLPHLAGLTAVRLAETGFAWAGGDGAYQASRFRKVERRKDKLNLTEWLSQPSGDTDGLDKTLPVKKRERVS